MPIFIDPDELSSNSLLPSLPDSCECPGLEALTGADFVISKLPLSPVDALDVHITQRSLFVQRKSGYDILSFDGLKSSIARMQKCKIPMPQAILLFIGKDWQGDDGLLRIENSKPFGDTTYKTFLKLKAKWRARGGIVDWLNNAEQLPMWIEAQQEVISDIEDEGKREIYPPRIIPTFEPNDIWQLVEEVSPDTIDYLLCAGLKGFGQKTITAVREYFKAELPHLAPSGHYFLSILTDMEDGKLKHNVKGWGIKRAQKLRDILLLPENNNLIVEGHFSNNDYQAGWMYALETFKELIDDGKNVKDAFNACVKQTKDLIPF